MNMDAYRLQALNNAWANATIYGVVRSLDAAAFTAPRPGFFGSLSRTLNHIHEVDLYYIDALKEGGLGRSVYERDDIINPNDLAAAQARADQDLASFCHALKPDDLRRRVATERPDATDVTERIDRLLLHLFQHQIHHRGQAHVMLSAAGVAPPQLDDFYLDWGRVPSARAYFE